MTSILCLAHYCDIHGPTPLMVTEGLPVPCSICYENELPAYPVAVRPVSSSSTPTSSTDHTSSAQLAEALRRLNLNNTRSSSTPASEQEAQVSRAALRRATQITSSSSAVETPPISPRYPQEPSYSGGSHHSRRESNYRRTYDDSTMKRAGPCDNCALTLPRRQESGSQGSGADCGPTLRTRAPYARVYGGGLPGDVSPPTSTSTDTDDDDPPRTSGHRRQGTITSTTSRSSGSSTSRISGHTHYLDYTSTHEPGIPSSYSIVRASCLRTLSFETLPRGAASTESTSMTSPSASGFITTHSSGAAASGGPIFFGDPSAGYTTAYIFRIPDVHARGHKRVYAFLALSTHSERLVMKAFTFLSAAFHKLALWIQGLAESEAEKYNESSGADCPPSAGGLYGGFGISQPQAQPIETSTTGSGFLTGGMGGLSRRTGGGFGGGGVSLKARGLAELVGLPDFFIELHSRFVRLLLELGVVLSS